MRTLFTAVMAVLVFGVTAIAETTDNQKLAGVWSWQQEDIRLTNRVAPDGRFTGQAAVIHEGRTNTYLLAGTWQIKEGRFIESTTKDDNKASPVPRSHSGQIYFTSPNEFAVFWQGSTNRTVWQRVSP